MPNDPIIFAVRTQFYYRGAKIETLTKEQLIDLLKKILKREIFEGGTIVAKSKQQPKQQ